ncbi:ABC transporter ATP-binding protein [Conexibacter stalactiti]|uniref:ABC transporter ATP-binding protein n=1 Tax=Conexibacter stalactiti TaxID=1940611 RepID=A0ABU4HTV2_9ACTN|nr:ABC transporter ATP-binding protein [Conexibacter stalactiti]MDW5596107.1 ABC transporter ATP-binding protein [Conexibacter stalactiti]MEC5036749.1 ABC transporter ATP-binding protein [Conexibacter stalactiti]
MSVRLTLEDVRVELGGNEILHGISLDVAPGEFVTLLGPSGSGKTTTLNVIAGLIRTSGGHVRFDGEPVEKRPPHDRDIGLVFQSYALFPHMTVGDNVGFPLRTRGISKGRRREIAERMLDLVHLPGMIDRGVRSLSGGQQQRVALARALAPEPSVLLLDEPMAALDKQLRETMQIEIKRIQASVGVTTVAVTHDQTEALTMSDRVAIMRDGHVEQLDAPEVLYRRPATLFAARFLGEANLLPVDAGRLLGFDAEVGARAGTAIVRPEELTLGERAHEQAPRIRASVRTTSFQGTRYRVECVHPQLGELVASIPPDVAPAAVAPGSEIEIACAIPAAIHVLADVVPPAEGAGAPSASKLAAA